MGTFCILLVIHVIAGFIALASAFIAAAIKTFNLPHKWHVYSGIAFVLGMAVIFVTAIPMAWMKSNVFLLLIAIFSFYLALSGWRYAKNRNGTPGRLDWGIAGLMAVASVGMIAFGVMLFMSNKTRGVTMAVFGLIGAALSFSDLQGLRRGGLGGKERIAGHSTMMLAGTIATVTAFLVTNFTFQPSLVLWLGPTVVITPFIVWWKKRILNGEKPKGMP